MFVQVVRKQGAHRLMQRRALFQQTTFQARDLDGLFPGLKSGNGENKVSNRSLYYLF
jgi:hypothetical protein